MVNSEGATGNGLTVHFAQSLFSIVSVIEGHEAKARAVAADPDVSHSAKLLKGVAKVVFAGVLLETTNI